jgi:hypothetical protein
VDRTLRERTHNVERDEAVLKVEHDCLTRWQVTLVPLGTSDRANSLSIADCDPLADMRIRFPIFLLTTHYWEGRWLLEMQELLPKIEEVRKQKGRTALEERWRRWMKLTPCIVSTLFMLPKHMIFCKRGDGGSVDDYLYDYPPSERLMFQHSLDGYGDADCAPMPPSFRQPDATMFPLESRHVASIPPITAHDIATVPPQGRHCCTT